jgi:hypothetical protein
MKDKRTDKRGKGKKGKRNPKLIRRAEKRREGVDGKGSM